MTAANDDITFQAMKQRIRTRLPDSIFETNPARMLLVPFWFLAALVGYYVILFTTSHWAINILIALMIGNCWGILSMFGHEVLHGGMGGTKRLQRLVASACGLPLFVSVYSWESGHIYRHHAHTNHPIRDVDTLGLAHRYAKRSGAQSMIDKFPGSGRWASLLFYAYAFTYQQVDRGLRIPGPKGKRIKIHLSLMLIFWGAVAIFSGPDVIYTVIIPILVGNAVALSYITTQHFLRPLSADNNAFTSTLSLSHSRLFTAMYDYSAYHLEHHLFPAIPLNKLPKVREIMLEEFPDKVAVMPYWQALKWVFLTPRVYADDNHLVDLRTPDKWFDLKAFERAILDPETDLARCTVSDFMVAKQ